MYLIDMLKCVTSRGVRFVFRRLAKTVVCET